MSALFGVTACRALGEGKCLLVRYGGYERTVEVHGVGRSREGREIMRVWQVRGGSASGAGVGWKMLRLHQMRSARIVVEPSQAPRPGYKRDDDVMKGGIACQL